MNKLESMGEVAQAILSDEEKEAVQFFLKYILRQIYLTLLPLNMA